MVKNTKIGNGEFQLKTVWRTTDNRPVNYWLADGDYDFIGTIEDWFKESPETTPIKINSPEEWYDQVLPLCSFEYMSNNGEYGLEYVCVVCPVGSGSSYQMFIGKSKLGRHW